MYIFFFCFGFFLCSLMVTYLPIRCIASEERKWSCISVFRNLHAPCSDVGGGGIHTELYFPLFSPLSVWRVCVRVCVCTRANSTLIHLKLYCSLLAHLCVVHIICCMEYIAVPRLLFILQSNFCARFFCFVSLPIFFRSFFLLRSVFHCR